MTVVERDIFIEASPDEIMEYSLYRPETLADWYVGVESVQADDVYPEPGGTLTLVYKAAGVTMETKTTVLEFIPGEKFEQEMQGIASGIQTWTYTPQDDGTVVAARFDYQMQGGGIGKIADKLFVERTNIKQLEESLQNLKQAVEAGS